MLQTQVPQPRTLPTGILNSINMREDANFGSKIGQKNLKCKKCNRKAVFICSGCRTAWYCDPECQVDMYFLLRTWNRLEGLI